MYKEILRSIDNIEIWPTVSFVIFFLFFLVLLIWVFTADKKFIRYMKELPLDKNRKSEEEISTTKTSISQ